jgi:hypothetical protein
MSAENSFADQLFAAHRAHERLRDSLIDKILSFFGGLEEWPFEDLTHDSYDSSFELLGAKPGIAFTPEQQAELWSMGFLMCWICFQDGSEHYYSQQSGGPTLHKKPKADSKA